MMEDLFTTGQDIKRAITETNRRYLQLNTQRICETCRLWHTPNCYERRDYNRDAQPQDWCAGYKGRK
jgi:hypothetical protein